MKLIRVKTKNGFTYSKCVTQPSCHCQCKKWIVLKAHNCVPNSIISTFVWGPCRLQCLTKCISLLIFHIALEQLTDTFPRAPCPCFNTILSYNCTVWTVFFNSSLRKDIYFQCCSTKLKRLICFNCQKNIICSFYLPFLYPSLMRVMIFFRKRTWPKW